MAGTRHGCAHARELMHLFVNWVVGSLWLLPHHATFVVTAIVVAALSAHVHSMELSVVTSSSR